MGGTYGVGMLIMVCMCIFAMGTCIAATVPTSRPAGYSVTIDAKAPTTVQVIATTNYVVSLEGGSPSCAIIVRHFNFIAIAHLLWSTTYYVGSLLGATQCTLTRSIARDLDCGEWHEPDKCRDFFFRGFKLYRFGPALSHVHEGAACDCLVEHPTTCSKPTEEHYLKMNLGSFMSLNIVKRMQLIPPNNGRVYIVTNQKNAIRL